MRGVRTALLSGALVALTILALAPILATGRAEAPFAWLTGFGRTGSASPGGPGGSPSGTTSTAALAPLFDALGARRPVEPRLTGSSAHAPCEDPPADPDDLIPLPHCSPLPEPGTEAFRTLTRASTALLGDEGTGTSPDLLHARGLWHLLWPEQDAAADRAVEALETAALRTPDDAPKRARILSDLAAAYLVRAAGRDRPLDLIQAMDAADRALEADPALPEARFNHALALEKLWLRTPARTAWETYLDADATSPWAAEALRRHRILDEPTVLETWETDRPLLALAATEDDSEAVRALVRRYAAPARDWIEEELLPAWGEAVLDGDHAEAERTLTIARTVGRSLARQVGEHLPADSVAAIDAAIGGGREVLARGHQSFGVGFRHYREHDCAAASEAFADAEEELATVGSPLAARAILQQDICRYYRDPSGTISSLASLHAQISLDRYPTLAGRLAWVTGLCEFERGAFLAAQAHFRAGIDRFQRTGDPDRGALLAELGSARQALGETAEAWESRLAALTALAPHGNRQRLYNGFHLVAVHLLREGFPELAIYFASEVLEHARSWGEPGPLADAHLTRARVLLALQQDEEALEDLGHAERLTEHVPVGALRRRLEADLFAGRGRGVVRDDPGAAEQSLSAALVLYRAASHLVRVPDVLTARAEANRRLGELEGAERDLEQAIALVAELPGEGTDAPGGIGSRMVARKAYEAMIRLQLEERSDALAALRWAERSRRSMPTSDPMAASRRKIGAIQILEIPAPPGVIGVEYEVFDDRLVLWIVGRELGHVVRSISAAELERSVDALRAAIEAGVPESEIRPVAAILFNLLLRPAIETAAPGDTLVIVPDRSLHRLPFAALWDGERSAYAVERHPILHAPSLRQALSSLAPDRQAQRTWNRHRATVLSVGTSSFDRARHPRLPLVPHAEPEARAVAALYPSSDLLVGAFATPGGVLAGLEDGPDVLHVAGHTLVDLDRPERSALILSFDGSVGASDTLALSDLQARDLSALELVYLSSCRSAAAFLRSGRESLGGFAREFLEAGARSVVANLWAIDDQTSGETARRLHRFFLRNGSVGDALWSTQKALLASPRRELSHPGTWSGWIVLVG